MDKTQQMIAELFDLPGAQGQTEIVSVFRDREGRTAEQSRDYGRRCLEEGDYEGAVAHFRRALEQGPEDPVDAIVSLGAAYETSEKAPEALRQYREALRVKDSGEVHLAIAALYARHAHAKEQLLHLEKAVKLEPDNAFYHFKLSQALSEMGHPKAARSAAQGAVAAAPQEAFHHFWQGELLLRVGDVEDALRAYQAAIELSPGDDHLLARTAVALWRAGKGPQALRAVQLAGDMDPKKPAYAELARRFQLALGQEPTMPEPPRMDDYDEVELFRLVRDAGLRG